MLDKLRTRELERVNTRFAGLSHRFGKCQLRVFVNDEDGDGPAVTIDDGLGGRRGYGYRFWVTETPRVWWYCLFTGPHGAYHEYLEVSKQAAKAVQGHTDEWLGVTQDIRGDDYWTVLVFSCAWREFEGTPLRAWSDLVGEKGYASVDSRTVKPGTLGLRSELVIDPFSASCSTASLILEGLVPESVDRRNGRREEPGTQESILEEWGLSGRNKERRIAVLRALRGQPEGDRLGALSLAALPDVARFLPADAKHRAKQGCIARDCQAMSMVVEGGKGTAGYRLKKAKRRKVERVLDEMNTE